MLRRGTRSRNLVLKHRLTLEPRVIDEKEPFRRYLSAENSRDMASPADVPSEIDLGTLRTSSRPILTGAKGDFAFRKCFPACPGAYVVRVTFVGRRRGELWHRFEYFTVPMVHERIAPAASEA